MLLLVCGVPPTANTPRENTGSQPQAEIPGVATTIWLTHYSPYDVYGYFKPNEQLAWLEKTLKAVDRTNQPWLLVGLHAPW